jgi:hypothetical protein
MTSTESSVILGSLGGCRQDKILIREVKEVERGLVEKLLFAIEKADR